MVRSNIYALVIIRFPFEAKRTNLVCRLRCCPHTVPSSSEFEPAAKPGQRHIAFFDECVPGHKRDRLYTIGTFGTRLWNRRQALGYYGRDVIRVRTLSIRAPHKVARWKRVRPIPNRWSSEAGMRQ